MVNFFKRVFLYILVKVNSSYTPSLKPIGTVWKMTFWGRYTYVALTPPFSCVKEKIQAPSVQVINLLKDESNLDKEVSQGDAKGTHQETEKSRSAVLCRLTAHWEGKKVDETADQREFWNECSLRLVILNDQASQLVVWKEAKKHAVWKMINPFPFLCIANKDFFLSNTGTEARQSLRTYDKVRQNQYICGLWFIN